MTQMFKIDSVDSRNCLGTTEHRACQRKKNGICTYLSGIDSHCA